MFRNLRVDVLGRAGERRRGTDVQRENGSPRAGGGAEVIAATGAAGMLRRNLDSGWAGSTVGCANGGGGAFSLMHSGHSSVCAEICCPAPSSDFTTRFTAPALEQTSFIACGRTIGEAIAAPMDSANHTGTQRANRRAIR